MTSLDKLKLNRNTPTTIIFSGGNYLGVDLAKTLIEQKGFVIIVDEITEDKVKVVKDIYDNEQLLFVDNVGLGELKEELYRLDYFIYLNCFEENPLIKISSQQFLEKSNSLSSLIKLCLKFKTKFVYVDSLDIHQYLLSLNAPVFVDINKNVLNYNVSEFQRYSESLIIEYTQKVNLNGRVIRIGNIIGYGVSLNSQKEVIRLAKLAATQKNIKLNNDGLSLEYLVSIQDSVYGILKSLFEDITKGKIYSLCYPQEITSLTLAYKLSEIEPKAGQIIFDESQEELPPNVIDTTENLSVIGWEPKVSLERALTHLVKWINNSRGKIVEKKHEIENMKPITREKKSPISDTAKKEAEVEKKEAAFIKRLSILSKSKTKNSKIVLSDRRFREKIASGSLEKGSGHNRKNLKYKLMFFFKTLTVRRIINYFFIAILFFVLYFLLISPLARNAKSVYELYSFSKLDSNYSDYQSEQILLNTRSVVNDLTNAKFLFETFKLNNLYNSLYSGFNYTYQFADVNNQVKGEREEVSAFFESKKIKEKSTQESELTQESKIQKLLDLNETDYKTNIPQLDNALSRIRENIKTNSLEPLNAYMDLTITNPIFNFYSDTVSNPALILVKEDKKGTSSQTVSYFALLNLSDSGYTIEDSGSFQTKLKPTKEVLDNIQKLVDDKATKKEKDSSYIQLVELLKGTMDKDIGYILIVNQSYLSKLLANDTLEFEGENLDSIGIERSLTSLKTEKKYELISTLLLNYLNRSIEFDDLITYLTILNKAQLEKSMLVFTSKDI